MFFLFLTGFFLCLYYTMPVTICLGDSMQWLFKIIDKKTLCEASEALYGQTDKDFDNYSFSHCSIINFSPLSAQIEFYCTRVADYRDNNIEAWAWGRMRSCYCWDKPNVSVLRRIWDRNADSHKHIKEYLRTNKPISSIYESDLIWAYSIILGRGEE